MLGSVGEEHGARRLFNDDGLHIDCEVRLPDFVAPRADRLHVQASFFNSSVLSRSIISDCA